MSGDDVDAILSESVFSNAAHKKALGAKLFEKSRELTIDDLDQVIGGLGVTRSFLEDWTDFPKEQGKKA